MPAQLLAAQLLYVLIWATIFNYQSFCFGDSVCPDQPIFLEETLMKIFEKSSPDMNLCIFKSPNVETYFQYSSVTVNDKPTVPDSQGWSVCKYCGYKNDQFELYQRGKRHFNNSLQSQHPFARVDMAWSLWGEFFHSLHNDQYSASVVEIDDIEQIMNGERLFIVDRPVFILPMITFHVGHILIDLLEQIYHAMITTYGEIRRDALIVLDVAGDAEKNVLQEKLYQNIYHKAIDNVGQILRKFTGISL